jgi:hypothetical protein
MDFATLDWAIALPPTGVVAVGSACRRSIPGRYMVRAEVSVSCFLDSGSFVVVPLVKM